MRICKHKLEKLFELKIYGEISDGSNRKGFCGLVDVQNQLAQAEGKDLKVRINSIGGDVSEGFAIYSELRRYAKENNTRITTIAEGRCASIATVIFLAGDERIVSKYVEPFVHYAWTEMSGSADDFRNVANDLERINRQIAKHYADHTLLNERQALDLMGKDTSLTPEECVQLRFATKIEEVSRPKALIKALKKTDEIYKPIFDMNFKNKSERRSFLDKVKKALGFSNKILYTADNVEIDFYELGEDEIVEAGAKAMIDGQPANGTYIVPDVESGDSKKYVFDAGVLISIEEADSEGEDEDVAALRAEVEALKSENEALNAEAAQTAEVLNALNEKFEAIQKEKNVFQAQAKALQAKVNSNSKILFDLKEKKTKTEDATDIDSAIASYRERKFKNK